MKLVYEAYNQSGQPVRGSIDAAGTQEATEKLYRDGLYVTRIQPADPAAAGRKPPRSRRLSLGGNRSKNLASFSRQLAVLVGTGTQVVQALAAVERQSRDPRWRAVVGGVRARVEEGESLVQAMERYPSLFGPVFRSLIAAGESGGQLHKMLERLAAMTRQQLKVRSALLGAMTYPVLLIFVSVVVVLIMLTTVLPRFAGLFSTLDAPVPPTTQMLMDLSELLRTRWWLFLGVAIASAGGLTFWIRTPGGRIVRDRLAVRLPLVGRFFGALITARIARILGVLLESRVPMLEAIRLTREAAGNRQYAALLDRAERAVTDGEPISLAFRDESLVSPSVFEAVQTGEATGQLGPILVGVADALDEDNEIMIRALTSILEPVILIILGAVVGFVAVSMFMPLFDLTSAAQG